MSGDLCATLYVIEGTETKRKMRLFLNESADLFLVGVHVGVFAVLMCCSVSVGIEAVSRSSLAISRFV
jgi:hypothetical protein